MLSFDFGRIYWISLVPLVPLDPWWGWSRWRSFSLWFAGVLRSPPNLPISLKLVLRKTILVLGVMVTSAKSKNHKNDDFVSFQC